VHQRIPCAVAVLVLCVSGAATAQDRPWFQVDSTRIGVISIDAQSLRREAGGTRLAWFKVDRLSVKADTDADRVTRHDSERWRYRFDCTHQRYMRLQRLVYLKDQLVSYIDLEHGVMDGKAGVAGARAGRPRRSPATKSLSRSA
jgi:hypothetical protein